LLFAGVVATTVDEGTASISFSALQDAKDYYSDFILNVVNSI